MREIVHAPANARPAPASRPLAAAPPLLRRTFTDSNSPPAPAPPIQRKPAVNAPDDPFEREADAAAEAVMRMAGPPSSAAPVAVQRKCAACADEEHRPLQTRREPAAANDRTLDVGTAVRAARQGGTPLSKELRDHFEPRFGHDFSRVRVHADGPASAGARAVQARAYTLGRDVVFGAGEYAPATRAGQWLLAHELSHVIQQDGGRGKIQRALIYGSGYARPYTSDPPEIRDTIALAWFPSSVDMQATADHNGGGTGASTFSALLAGIAGQATGSINQLGLIGHSNAIAFGLGGTIKPGNNVYFDPAAVITSDVLDQNAAAIAPLKTRFASGAKIILYGCDAGSGTALMDKISQSFGVCVSGFKGPLSWCLSWNGEKTRITSRGNVAYANPDDVATQIGLATPTCSSALSSLTPDFTSCKGVPPASPAPPPPGPGPSAPGPR